MFLLFNCIMFKLSGILSTDLFYSNWNTFLRPGEILKGVIIRHKFLILHINTMLVIESQIKILSGFPWNWLWNMISLSVKFISISFTCSSIESTRAIFSVQLLDRIRNKCNNEVKSDIAWIQRWLSPSTSSKVRSLPKNLRFTFVQLIFAALTSFEILINRDAFWSLEC